MKTIGLIGGMSWESSKVYYQYTNEMVKEQLGGSHSAKSIMSSVDFAEIEKLTFENNWVEIGNIMALHAQKLEKAGADLIVLCTNTIHLVSDAISAATDIPFIHIAHATGNAVTEKRLKKVGLLGTRFTMEKEFYTRILQDTYQLQLVIPEQEQRQEIHDVIYNELVKGIFTPSSRQSSLRIIEQLVEQGAEGVILGCTELPLLLAGSKTTVPLFNTTEIHAAAAVKMALYY